MRTAILSEVERKLLKDYLERGIKTQHLYVVMHRIKNNIKQIEGDYELILAVLEHEAKNT